jgi:hypothetical protein
MALPTLAFILVAMVFMVKEQAGTGQRNLAMGRAGPGTKNMLMPHAISRLIGLRNSNKFCANLGNCAPETLAMIREAFGEERMSHTRKAQPLRVQESRDS